MLLCRQTSDTLFDQHEANAKLLGVPMCDVVREGTQRVTKLHYMQLPVYHI